MKTATFLGLAGAFFLLLLLAVFLWNLSSWWKDLD